MCLSKLEEERSIKMSI